MNIYLDIDGVLLANEKFSSLFAKEFLFYILTHYPDTTYWLTTHCQDGDASIPIKRLEHIFDSETIEIMKNIKPTKWSIAKTEAIDFSKPFLWFDDDLFPDEKEVLIAHGVLENWIEVNLYKKEKQLKDFIGNLPTLSN